MAERAVVIASIRDERTNRWVFREVEVSYGVNVDPKADEETRTKQILTTFWDHLPAKLRTLPKGTRVINNRKHYFVQIDRIATTNIH